MFCKSAAAAGVQRIRILGAQHLFEAGVHFFFLNELAVEVGLCNASPHGGPELHIFLTHAQGGILH